MNYNRQDMIRNMPSRKGFSLIELMAGMAILMIMVALMGVIFTNSDRVWSIGTGRANNNTDGRAALMMLSHDLQYAVADDLLTFAMRKDRYDLETYGFTNSEICFVSLVHDSGGDSPRTAREIHYYVRQVKDKPHQYELVRAICTEDLVKNPTVHCYYNKKWYESDTPNPGRPSNNPMSQNVVGFYAFAPQPPYPKTTPLRRDYYSSDTNNAAGSFDWSLSSNRMPMYVDVYLEVLNEDASERAASMAASSTETDADVKEYIEKNVRRYSTRVYFQNAHGYSAKRMAKVRR